MEAQINLQEQIQKEVMPPAPIISQDSKNGQCELLVEETAHTRQVFTVEALEFLFNMEQKFGATRRALLKARKLRQKKYDEGELPYFNPDTAYIRESEWKISPVPEVLQDRRVEITGPVDRKMMINALNSGAKVFMADFEDATSPTFENILNGQINIQDYASDTLEYTAPETGKYYKLNDDIALMIIRPRGLHMEEAHLEINGKPLSASFVDFGLHIFHNGRVLAEKGLGPFYYLPKMESHLEAQLWNAIFVYAQDSLGIPQGTIKATVLIETLPAAFEMDEILYELRHHIAGLNCGRWDYIFSYIKTLRNHPDFVLPDREQISMDKDFLQAYSSKLIHVCHKRGAHAMGGMAAQIPVKNDELANARAIKQVRADKVREAELYHDGTWVTHPALVKPALDIFNFNMPCANNLHRQCRAKPADRFDMLRPHAGEITEKGVRTNIAVALEYISSWLGGSGAVPINNLMEDAATAEICRMQIWQWLKFGCTITTQTGHVPMSKVFFEHVLQEEFQKLQLRITENLEDARDIFEESILSEEFQDFLTIHAYQKLIKRTV